MQCDGATQEDDMANWRATAARAQTLLNGDTSDAGLRTQAIIGHVLDEQLHDDYISKDFFNVQQTAGGLPDGVTMPDFIAAIAGHVRDDFASGSFDPVVGDDDFRIALLAIDENIRRHIAFLNGAVHQIAAGDVHRALWQLILDARSDPSSVYSCYQDFLVDA
jgi:hypothetical protein